MTHRSPVLQLFTDSIKIFFLHVKCFFIKLNYPIPKNRGLLLKTRTTFWIFALYKKVPWPCACRLGKLPWKFQNIIRTFCKWPRFFGKFHFNFKNLARSPFEKLKCLPQDPIQIHTDMGTPIQTHSTYYESPD